MRNKRKQEITRGNSFYWIGKGRRMIRVIVCLAAFLLTSYQVFPDSYLILGECTSEVGGGVYGKEFWKKTPRMQGTIVHNYIFEVWADMGFLALGASIDKNIKQRIRPDFYFDGVIRDVKPLTKGKTKKQVAQRYKEQFRKYAEAVYEINGGHYYPDVEIVFYQLDRTQKVIRFFSEPYRVDMEDLGISPEARTMKSRLHDLDKFLGNIGTLKCAIYDKEEKEVVLIGQSSSAYTSLPSTGLRRQTILTAEQAVYKTTHQERDWRFASQTIADTGRKSARRSKLMSEDILVAQHAVFNTEYQGAMVTIDPDPENLRTRGVVKYGGGIEGTRVGRVLFNADFFLKGLSHGYDGFEKKPLEVEINGFKTLMDLYAEDDRSTIDDEWVRFWFTPAPTDMFSFENKEVLVFPENMLVVKAENMRLVGGELISDFTPDPSTPQGRFIGHLNKHYGEFVEEYPEIRELEDVAKVFALLKWFKSKNIFLDLNYIRSVAIERDTYVTHVPLIESTRKTKPRRISNEKIIQGELKLLGGVDLQNFEFRKAPSSRYRDLVDTIRRIPQKTSLRHGNTLYYRNFFSTPSIPNMEIRKALTDKSLDLSSEETRKAVQVEYRPDEKIAVYCDENGITYYFKYDQLGRCSEIHGWDKPISYEYECGKDSCNFSYKASTDTGHYIKRLEYEGDADNVRSIEILKDDRIIHRFGVRKEGENLIVERRCK